MPKAVIWFLVGFGLLLLLVALATKSIVLGIIALVFIAAGASLIRRAVESLTKDQVKERWSILIENGQGKADDVLREARSLIEASQAPNIEISRREMSPGFIRGLSGRRRVFLAVNDTGNPRLFPFQMFLNCRDYGNNLAVDWYLSYKPSTKQALLSLIPYVREAQEIWNDLDLFDLQDMTAYVTNAHHCMVNAVVNLMRGLDQDPTKIDRMSRGFLGVS